MDFNKTCVKSPQKEQPSKEIVKLSQSVRTALSSISIAGGPAMLLGGDPTLMWGIANLL